jgi:DHA2 family methylenomycin A resistance protein-like MFS transporter
MPSSPRSKPLILAAMCLGTFMAILDTSLVNLGLHSIQSELRTDIAVLQWVIDLYNLSYAVLILSGGTLADLYGRRRLFLIGVAVFAIGSLVCAVAPDAATLIAGRGIAGIGAALELPAALAILNVSYPDARERAHAIAIWAAMNGLAMAIGPTLGGLLVDAFGWRSLFYVILPVAAATFLVAVRAVPESADPKGRHLDLPGQLTAITALGALAFGFIEGPRWGWSAATLLCFGLFVLSTAAFVIIERHSRSPMVPLTIFANRAFSAAITDATLMTFGMYGLLFVLPLYLQAVRGEAATVAGIALLPMSFTFFVVSPFAGKIATTVGPRILIAGGMGLTGAGILSLAALTPNAGFLVIAPPLFAIGVGLGLITGPISTAAVANAPAARSGMSSGLVNVGRMVGATLGVAVLGLLFGARGAEAAKDVPEFMTGLRLTFLLGGVAELAGAAVAVLWFRKNSLETSAQAQPSR